ncbi:MAG TPA: diacylglycerol kinase family protein [Acidimicrobiales bacterium]|nr:diacylglycerol kinase family protein [Acidimicrobiales bacterium]
MRLLLIVNTSASSVTARARVVIQKSLAADHEVTVAETSRRGHATRLAQGAASRGTDVVVVLGGDGTLNEAANGIAGTDCALGVLPGGSTNVFARTIGMTNDPIEATGELLSALGRGPSGVRTVGLGSVNGRRFLFHVGVGFDAAVVAQVERRSAIKKYLGHAFFAYAALDTWARGFDRRHPHFSVELERLDGEKVEVENGYFAIVLNTNPYTFLGERPFNVAPAAGLDTPLSMVVLRSLGAGTVLGLAAVALRGNEGLRTSRKVSVVDGVVAAVVRPREDVPYQVDGDYLGDAGRLEFGWEPETLRLVVPRRPQGTP